MSDADIYVVEDDEAVRDSLQLVLQETGCRIHPYASAESFLAGVRFGRPSCLILDLRMPGMSGMELLQELQRQGQSLPTIVITAHGDIPSAVRAMQLGALDFLQKPFDNQLLLERVSGCIRDELAELARSEQRKDSIERLASLTGRERQVLDLTVAGRLNKQIAHELGISPRTVEVHRANIRRKLGVERTSELVRIAVIAGLGEDQPR